jgi:hypothetical protein
MHPIEQFEIRTLFPIVKIGSVEIAFTNSALYMLIGVARLAPKMVGLGQLRERDQFLKL